MCGKDWYAPRALKAESGSPPHVRERHDPRRAAHQQHGITPACAGKTIKLHEIHYTDGDHPRMCGKD